jgi:DNA replication protein DnaC
MEDKNVRFIRTQVSLSGEVAGHATPRSIAESPKQSKGAPACALCGDTGWKTLVFDHEKRVTRCDCTALSRSAHLLAQAHIPPRYENCDLASYQTEGSQRGVASSKLAAEKFVEQYPLDKTGLLLIGPSGAGKTHLSVAILKDLIVRKGIPCLFSDYRELLKQIQNSYNPSVQVTELDLLRPLFQTEVLVLDDLGAVKPTEWVWDTVSVILNTRYNETRTTIITTNFQDGPAAALAGARGAAREETLGDRIGERMRSRLSEMCRSVNLNAPDYRQKFRTANLR